MIQRDPGVYRRGDYAILIAGPALAALAAVYGRSGWRLATAFVVMLPTAVAWGSALARLARRFWPGDDVASREERWAALAAARGTLARLGRADDRDARAAARAERRAAARAALDREDEGDEGRVETAESVRARLGAARRALVAEIGAGPLGLDALSAAIGDEALAALDVRRDDLLDHAAGLALEARARRGALPETAAAHEWYAARAAGMDWTRGDR